MEHKKHNLDYKLVGVIQDMYNRSIELVYGESNEGLNQGLEVYFYKPKSDHFYTSRRFKEGKVPGKYMPDYNLLKGYVIRNEVLPGHKLTLEKNYTLRSNHQKL